MIFPANLKATRYYDFGVSGKGCLDANTAPADNFRRSWFDGFSLSKNISSYLFFCFAVQLARFTRVFFAGNIAVFGKHFL
jgi:hypothetical protein